MKEHKKILIGVALALGILALVGVYSIYMPQAPSTTVLPTTTLTIGTTKLEVELATTKAEQERGLSGRASLGEGQGMLFVFDTENKWGIWMKGMLFPLDIIWADKNGIIVTIEHDVSPATYPAQTFSPNVPAQYVLEVPTGFTKSRSIAVGDKIVVQ